MAGSTRDLCVVVVTPEAVYKQEMLCKGPMLDLLLAAGLPRGRARGRVHRGQVRDAAPARREQRRAARRRAGLGRLAFLPGSGRRWEDPV